MGLNYVNSINNAGLPPVVDARQVRVHVPYQGNQDAFLANELQLMHATDSYIREAQQHRQPFVDLYDIVRGPHTERLENKTLPDGMTVHRLGLDTIVIHTHHSSFDDNDEQKTQKITP